MALGEGENFFSREKAERRHRSFPLSPNPSPLFKKSGVVLFWRSSARAETDPLASVTVRSCPSSSVAKYRPKQAVFCDCSNLPVLPDTQPLTHPLPVRGTSQGGKAAVFTSSLQSASFATSHPLGGVFCKVESSPLLEIIYPYGEQSLQKKRRIL